MKQREYLFLCHGGEKRSQTAVSVGREIAKEKGLDIEMTHGSSDSINKNNQNIEYLARNLNNKYEKIFVMQDDIAKKLESIGIKTEKIYCLNIDDKYERNDPELIKILREKLISIITVEHPAIYSWMDNKYLKSKGLKFPQAMD